MCGRFALSNLSPATIWTSYPRVRPARFENEERFHGRYNIAPRTYSPVLRRQGSEIILQSMRWGVVPHYSKHEDKSLSTINAKGEHLTDGTSALWNGLKGKKRCVVPVQGYYEWLKKSNAEKVPHFTKYKGQKIMLLAGLWDVVTLEDSQEPLYTFTIVTTDASKQLSFLHDRMPVVLASEDDIELWLSDSEWSKEIAHLIRPREDITFDCYAVHKEVGKVGTEDPSFILPVSQRKDGIAAMFKKQTASASQPKDIFGPGNPKAESEPSQSSTEPVQSPAHINPKDETPLPSILEIVDDDEGVKNNRATPTSPRNTGDPSSGSPISRPKAESSPGKKRKYPSKSTGAESSPTKKTKKSSEPSFAGGPRITRFFKPKPSS